MKTLKKFLCLTLALGVALFPVLNVAPALALGEIVKTDAGASNAGADHVINAVHLNGAGLNASNPGASDVIDSSILTQAPENVSGIEKSLERAEVAPGLKPIAQDEAEALAVENVDAVNAENQPGGFLRTSLNQLENSVGLSGDSSEGAFRQTVFGRLIQTVSGKLRGTQAFDGAPSYGFGIMERPRHPKAALLPEGIALDPAPLSPEKTAALVPVQRFHLARDHKVDGFDPITLDIDPADPKFMDEVEKALRDLVDANPTQFGTSAAYGPPSQDMHRVSVERLAGLVDDAESINQGDSVIAVFRQKKEGQDQEGRYVLAVDGGDLRFHIKILNEKPVLMAHDGGFGAVDPAVMNTSFTDEELEKKAIERLNLPPDSGRGVPARSGGKKSSWARKLHLKIRSSLQPKPVLLTRAITTVDGDNLWRAVNIYRASDLKGQSVIVMVDVKTGKSWAFSAEDLRAKGRGYLPTQKDSSLVKQMLHAFRRKVFKAAPNGRSAAEKVAAVRHRPQKQAPAPEAPVDQSNGNTIAGVAVARGDTLTPDGKDHGPVGEMPLINAKVFNAQGDVLTITDDKGNFTIPVDGKSSEPIVIVVRLEGIYGAVKDADGNDQPLEMKLTVRPGQQVRVVLNPAGEDEQEVASVNTYVYSSKLFWWFKEFLGLKDPRLYTPLAGDMHTNDTSMPANAFYDPEKDAFYLMKKAILKFTGQDGKQHAVAVENTGQPSIELHELGHRFVQMLAQFFLTAEQHADHAYRFVKWLLEPVMAPDVNEGFADMVSTFIRDNPVLGNEFSNPPFNKDNNIRDAEDATQFDAQNTDPHYNGGVFNQIGWGGRKDFKNRMPKNGALYAAYLFVRTTMYIQPGDVVSALMHIRLAAMTKDGKLPHDDVILKPSRDRGINLPTLPSPPRTPKT